jgi:hypothetical protein
MHIDPAFHALVSFAREHSEAVSHPRGMVVALASRPLNVYDEEALWPRTALASRRCEWGGSQVNGGVLCELGGCGEEFLLVAPATICKLSLIERYLAPSPCARTTALWPTVWPSESPSLTSICV